MLAVLGGAFSLILYGHGASWWYAPLALPGLALAHLAILGGVLVIGMRATRGRRALGLATDVQEGAERSEV